MDAKELTARVALERAERLEIGKEAVHVHLCRKGCGSFACSVCGPIVGLKLRDRLTERYKAAKVKRVGLFTLSINDKVMPGSPGEQYRRVVEGRLVGEFMREVRATLGVEGGYFRICEFGDRSNRLHFHVLVDDLGRISRSDLRHLQNWCQAHLGTMDYKWRWAEVGIRYVCKYLTKGSEGKLPDFVLDTSGFKFVSTSRGFWMMESEPRRVPTKPSDSRKQRTLRVRLATCGDGVVGMAVFKGADGLAARSFLFALPIPFERVVESLNDIPREGVVDIGSTWPVGVLRWVQVEPELVKRLLVYAALRQAGGRRAAQRLGGRGP